MISVGWVGVGKRGAEPTISAMLSARTTQTAGKKFTTRPTVEGRLIEGCLCYIRWTGRGWVGRGHIDPPDSPAIARGRKLIALDSRIAGVKRYLVPHGYHPSEFQIIDPTNVTGGVRDMAQGYSGITIRFHDFP